MKNRENRVGFPFASKSWVDPKLKVREAGSKSRVLTKEEL